MGAPAAGDTALSARRELARKGLHVLSALAPVAYALGLGRLTMVLGLAALTMLAIAVETLRGRVGWVRARFERAVGRLLRTHEWTRWCGATWLLIALLVAAAVFPRAAAIAAMWALSIGDASAAVVGRLFGRHRLGGRKSLEGALACVAATFVGARWVAHLAVGPAVVGSLVAGLAEWPERPLDDNLRIALGTGVSIVLWRMAFA